MHASLCFFHGGMVKLGLFMYVWFFREVKVIKYVDGLARSGHFEMAAFVPSFYYALLLQVVVLGSGIY